jgi:ABC-type Mn2+/Zn2+ transport system permease subunit
MVIIHKKEIKEMAQIAIILSGFLTYFIAEALAEKFDQDYAEANKILKNRRNSK